MAVKSSSNPLHAEKLYLLNTAVTFKLKMDTGKKNHAFLLNYLDMYLPVSEEYMDDELIKGKLGSTYRFDCVNVLESDCTVKLNEGHVWLDADLDYIYNIETLNRLSTEQQEYLFYLLKIGYTVDLIAEGGIYKFYDRLHDKVCLVDGEVELEIRIVPK